MSSINNATSGLYLDSLVSYINDVKPYRTKIATGTGAVTESYLFSDVMNVAITETDKMTVFLGADIMPSAATLITRARRSQSWYQDIVSDGQRNVWPVPLLSVPKFASQASLQNFVYGDHNEYTGIPGLTHGVFNDKRWDGPGISDVQKNGIHQQDTIGYTLSHGIFTFDILTTDQSVPGRYWKQSDLEGITGTFAYTFNNNPGQLIYENVYQSIGNIIDITGTTYEEWTLTCTNESPFQVSVVGNISGNIGTATFEVPFVSAEISFTWGPAFPADTSTDIIIGQNFILTPSATITISPTAPVETWSLIKSNPIALTSAPVFTSTVFRDTPALEVHTRNIDSNGVAVTWTLIFQGNGTYNLTRSNASPNGISYPINVDLQNGCSFNNADIAFTILPTTTPFILNDEFTWVCNASPAHYKVFGSVSGWMQDATIGQWYWNGLIGFKIPALTYFAQSPAINQASSGNTPDWIAGPAPLFVPLENVRSMAEPSVYTITFTSPTNATVQNNIYGWRAGLITNTPWNDEFSSFQINTVPGLSEYVTGDVVQVYLAPSQSISVQLAGYDSASYDTAGYDADATDQLIADGYNQEKFPLYHGHGAVIFPNAATGDQYIIDKTFYDRLQFKLVGSTLNHPELAAVNDWVPLEFRYFDRVDTVTGLPTSLSEFSDLTTYVQAYSAANPNQLIFSIAMPRYEKTNRNASAILTIDSTFFATYLGVSNRYSFEFLPDQSYGQTIRVKITENIKIYEIARLEFAEGPANNYYLYQYNWNTGLYSLVHTTTPALPYPFNLNITEDASNPFQFYDVKIWYTDLINTTIAEGGSLPFLRPGYGIVPYGTLPYQDITPNGILPEMTGMPPFSIGNQPVYTGNPNDWIMVSPTTFPSIAVFDNPPPDMASSQIIEGLTIMETVLASDLGYDDMPYDTDFYDSSPTDIWTNRLSVLMDATQYPINNQSPPHGGLLISIVAGEYLVNWTGPAFTGTPTVIIASMANPGSYYSPSVSLNVYLQDPTLVSTNAFVFNLSGAPVGFTVPFKLWITQL